MESDNQPRVALRSRLTVVRLGLTLFTSRSFLQARTACLKPDSLSDMHPCSRWWKVSAVMGAPFDAISSTIEKAVSKSPQRPNAFGKTQPSRGTFSWFGTRFYV